MSEKTIRLSDFSGTEGAEEVQFGFAGEMRVVDLSEQEKQEFEALLRPYLQASRPAPRRQPKRDLPSTTAAERTAIRRWAKNRGLTVADRGVVPRRIIEAYRGRHSAPAS